MNKYSALLLLAVLAVGFAGDSYQTFEDYATKQGQRFVSDAEKLFRKSVYDNNVKSIADHNNNPAKTHTEGVNQFTGLTKSEFKQQMLGTRVPTNFAVAASTPVVGAWAPTVVDLTTKLNWITAVKNQGCCGSCWAFSALGAMESLSFIANATKAADYSEQQLVDCSSAYGNNGCNGGWMNNAFNYIKAYGITSEANYPYKTAYTAWTSCVTGTCNTVAAAKQIAKVSGYTAIAASCTSVAAAIPGRPLSVAVDATNWSPYVSGVFSNCNTAINHGVLLVGVNTTAWKIKNSWGTGWGQAGFIYLSASNGNNTCNVCTYASYPNK